MKSLIPLAVISLAAYRSFAIASSAFTVSLTRNHNGDAHLHGPPALAAQARASFFVSGVAHQQRVNTPLVQQAFFYTINIQLGSPPTTYNLLFDTGSSNTAFGVKKPYRLTSTSIPTGESLNVTYGSGSILGDEYLDQVNVAPSLTIKNQSVGYITSSVGLDLVDVDGIAGFGPVILTTYTLSPDQTLVIPTIMDNLVTQKLIEKEIFGIYFAPASNADDMNGLLTYGGPDPSLFNGELTYVPVTTTIFSAYFWGINITSCSYGRDTIIPTSTAGIVDSGTSVIFLPSDAIEAYVQIIPGAFYNTSLGLIDIPPSSIPFMRPFHFVIGWEIFTLDVCAQLLPESQNEAWGGEAGHRYGVIAELPDSEPRGIQFVLGMPFMERFYTVFDAHENRIGFAQTDYTFSDVW